MPGRMISAGVSGCQRLSTCQRVSIGAGGYHLVSTGVGECHWLAVGVTPGRRVSLSVCACRLSVGGWRWPVAALTFLSAEISRPPAALNY